jgi:hypothetical protein
MVKSNLVNHLNLVVIGGYLLPLLILAKMLRTTIITSKGALGDFHH